MKRGLGIYKKYRIIIAYMSLIRFRFLDLCIGFDMASLFLSRVDKISTQLILKKHGASIGKNCDIESGLNFHNCKGFFNLIIGNNCHIGKNCFFDLKDKIHIGDNVVISMNCTFITHMDLSRSRLNSLYPPQKGPILIESNSYIGVNTTVLMNSIIGSQSIVGAGSLINRDVEPKTIAGGIPAKTIKKIH